MHFSVAYGATGVTCEFIAHGGWDTFVLHLLAALSRQPLIQIRIAVDTVPAIAVVADATVLSVEGSSAGVLDRSDHIPRKPNGIHLIVAAVETPAGDVRLASFLSSRDSA